MAASSGYNSIVIILVGVVLFISAVTAAAANTTAAILIRVDQSGSGDYTTIQDAIDSVPSNNNSQLYFIWVKPGIYRETVVVPEDKPFITLSGTKDSNNTIITANATGTIFESPTLSILASDFVGRYLTIQNSYGSSNKAVALRVSADSAAFYSCRIISYQDTLLDDLGRHYYKNCYIEGATDFIFGNAASLFERCHIRTVSMNAGCITAHHRESSSDNTGFIFLGGKISGVKAALLGRPWGDYARVVFAYMYMPGVILPQGWDDWGQESVHSTAVYGEYKNYGPGSNIGKRVNWSRHLTDAEAKTILTKDMIGKDWLRPTPTQFINRASAH